MQVNEKTIQASARLCDAIKWHPCLYDSKSKVFQMKHAVDAAWRSIANECEDTVANCKFRWRIIRKSFAISVRKFGSKSRHYLSDYLDFLRPHVNSIDINDDSVDITGEIDIDEEMEEDEDDEDDDDEDHEEDDEEGSGGDEEEEDMEEEHNEAAQEYEGHDSDTTTAEESVREKAAEKRNRQRRTQPTVVTPEVAEDIDDQHTGSQNEDGARQGRRIIRMRKAPKRFLDTEMYGRNSANQDEKRARRSTERKKSAGMEDNDRRKTTATLQETIDKRKSATPSEEYDKRKTATVVEEHDKRKAVTVLPKKRVEVKLVKTKLVEPATAEQKGIRSKSPDKLRLASTDKASRTFFLKPDKAATNSDSGSAKTDRSTPVVEAAKKPVNRGTQCDNDVPKTIDEEFLDTIKPQMELMNSRQKFNFKKRVYQALMDVFDDGTNFPNKDEVVELPPTGAPRFDTTTVGELRLMRELVQLVQAAKSTPEIMDANDKLITSVDSSPSPTPPPTEKSLCHATGLMINERKSNSPNIGERISKRSETLGLPRHILQKVVKVAGSNGGTILAHEGEKRRVYRIYPKGTLPPSVANSAVSASASIGTFYVTPPKSTTASSSQNKTVASSGNPGKPIMFNGKVVNHLPNSNQANANNSNTNNSVTRQKLTVRSQASSDVVTPRRISQGAGATTGNNSTLLLQNKNITSTNPSASLQPKSTPTSLRTVQRVPAWDDTPKSSTSSGLSQIQISQPISLNASANIKNSVKAFLESGTESERPGETSPNTILPDGGIPEEDGTGALITGDSYDPLLIKTLIKDEPSEFIT